jgi:YD repeat-containing protein
MRGPISLRWYSVAAILVLAAIVNGCNKNEVTPTPTPTCYPTAIITADGAFIYNTVITYDSQNRIMKKVRHGGSGTRTTVFIYDSKGDMVETGPEGSTETFYTYDEDHRIITESSGDYLFAYAYNASGQLVTKTFSSASCPSCSDTWTYTYPNTTTRNYATLTTTYSGEPRTTRFEYDSNFNPARSLELPSLATDNNIVREVTAWDTFIHEVSYAYQYDAQGYPISVVVPIDFSYGRLTIYTYQCE